MSNITKEYLREHLTQILRKAIATEDVACYPYSIYIYYPLQVIIFLNKNATSASISEVEIVHRYGDNPDHHLTAWLVSPVVFPRKQVLRTW